MAPLPVRESGGVKTKGGYSMRSGKKVMAEQNIPQASSNEVGGGMGKTHEY